MDTINKKWFIFAAIILYILANGHFIYKIFSRKKVKQEYKSEFDDILILASFSCSLVYCFYIDNQLGMLYSSIKIAIILAIIVGKFLYS